MIVWICLLQSRISLAQKLQNHPVFYIRIRQLWLATLFTAAFTPDIRKVILEEFRRQDSVLRLVIASSAFGLGVNIPDISRIINWGLPQNLEDLVQESGRAGRNGSQAQAILYHRGSAIKASKLEHDYAENDSVCRSYCILRGQIKGFNRSITTILFEVGSYRTVVG